MDVRDSRGGFLFFRPGTELQEVGKEGGEVKMAPTATSELKKAGTRADFSDISENQTPQKVAGANIQDTTVRFDYF